tara:strand:- start:4202 stop:4591 length:390 start_codon:yes stop_codon:yes gene_type:complete
MQKDINKIYDYIISFIGSCEKNKYKLPSDLYKYIFSFIEDDFKKIINYTYLNKYLEKKVADNFSNDNDDFYFHYEQLPYPNVVKRKDIRYQIYSFFRGKVLNYVLSEECCSGNGLKYVLPKRYNHFTLS